MATKADVISDLDYLSTTVGDRSRVIAFAVIAIWWGDLIGNAAIKGLPPERLLPPVVLAGISVLLDLFQYGLAYWFQRGTLKEMERAHATTTSYDTQGWESRTRLGLFYGKLGFMLFGLGWLIVVLVPVAVRSVTGG
jgi:hypothetical protein